MDDNIIVILIRKFLNGPRPDRVWKFPRQACFRPKVLHKYPTASAATPFMSSKSPRSKSYQVSGGPNFEMNSASLIKTVSIRRESVANDLKLSLAQGFDLVTLMSEHS